MKLHLKRGNHDADVERLITLVDKKHKSAFETYLCKQPYVSKFAYLDLLGTKAFRQNDLNGAFKAFSQIPEQYLNARQRLVFYPPEVASIKYLRDPLGQIDTSIRKCNKKTFVKWIIDKKHESIRNPGNSAEIFISLAYAYLDCTYHGNSWKMMNYFRGSQFDHASPWEYEYIFGDMSETIKQNKAFFNNYYYSDIAKEYFKKVKASGLSRERQAEVHFMLFNGTEQYFKDFCKYSSTKFYEEYGSCIGADSYCGY